MADVATMTGIVGILIGVAGSIMGFLGYSQSRANTVLDLRLQLRRDVNVLRAVFDPLHQAIDAAVQSRTAMSAAHVQAPQRDVETIKLKKLNEELGRILCGRIASTSEPPY